MTFNPKIILIAIGLAACSLVSGAQNQAEDKKWDVNDTSGKEFKTIKLTTKETTWSNLTLSPDGKTMVFDMLGDLYSVPSAGGTAKALTNSLAWDYQPTFSPDGKTLAFISDRDGSDNLWIMNADGSQPRQISKETAHMIHNPAFSPDGTKIVAKKGFVSSRSIPAGEIWLYHTRGGQGNQIRERLHGKTSQKNIAEPVFSADGQSIYYSVDNTPGRVWQYNKNSLDEIYVIRRWHLATGEEETIVSGPGGAIRPTPSHDGSQLAFVKREDFQSALYIKNLASGNETRLYVGLDRDLQEANGTQGNTPAFAFTPDDKAIVFWAKGHFHKINLADQKITEIPVSIATEKKIAKALRYPVTVAPDEFQVKMPRWGFIDADRNQAVFQALGYLYTKDLKSGAIKRLTQQNERFEFFPALSRDGKKLVYTTWHDQKLGDIRIWDFASGSSTVVSKDPGHYIEPAFGPQGKKIAYRKVAGGYLLDRKWSAEPGLYVLNLADGATNKLRVSGHNPHFGADPERVFFSDINEEDNQLELFSANLEGLDKRSHYKGTDLTALLVSPDGKYLAFREQFKAYVAPFIQTGKTLEINSKSDHSKVSRLSDHAGAFFHWTSESDALEWSQGPQIYRQTLAKVFAYEDKRQTSQQKTKGDEQPLPAPESVAIAFTVPTAKPQGIKAFVGAQIVTMRDADQKQEVIAQGTVVTKGDRILAVGPKATTKVPKDATIYDVSGHTIVPGFVDAHAHGGQGRSEIIPQQNWINFSNVSFGVTTIHDPSNDTSEVFAAAELQKAGLVTAPRIFSTGTILYGAIASGYTAKINTYDDAKFHVQRLKDVGAISVKSYQQPLRSGRQMVIKAGRELGMMVVPEGGARYQYNMGMIADGHTGIEHAIPLYNAYDDVLQFWSASNTYYTPTFVVAYGGLGGENYWYDRTDVWKNPRLMRYVPHYLVDPIAVRRQKAPTEHYNHFGVARFAKKLRDRGVKVQIGAHGQREGLGAHWEMWMMAQGGFTPFEALRSGSWDGAHYLGMDKDIGSLEVGKLADLVVIEGDPLKDIRQSEFVKYTMIGGKLYEAATMNRLGPDGSERQAFFFEGEHVTGMHPSAQKYWQHKKQRYHWTH